MATSIKNEVIGLLTNHRELTSAEHAELDTLGVALSLRDDDPMWGQVVWAWAVTPRKEYLSIAHQALAAELRSDLKLILDTHQPASDAPRLDEIKKLIESRPAAPFNADAIKVMLEKTLDAKKGVIDTNDVLKIIRETATEIVSWANVAIGSIIVGLCLFIGYSFGYTQSEHDQASLHDLEQQVQSLTQALPKHN